MVKWTLRRGKCGNANFPDVLRYEVKAGEGDLAVFDGTIAVFAFGIAASIEASTAPADPWRWFGWCIVLGLGFVWCRFFVNRYRTEQHLEISPTYFDCYRQCGRRKMPIREGSLKNRSLELELSENPVSEKGAPGHAGWRASIPFAVHE